MIRARLALAALPLLAVPPLPAAETLEVVEAGPRGEVSAPDETSEIRLVFSRPMVVLGRVPSPVTAPFLRVRPAVEGTLRWSGTTTLLLKPSRPLPFATRFEVTVDETAVAVDGSRLTRPFSFAFTTPTVRLEGAEWYREKGHHDAAVVLALRFNQPVLPEALRSHLRLSYQPHDWEAPTLAADAIALIGERDPASVVDFEAKVERARQATRLSSPVAASPARDWNRKRFPPADGLVVLRTEDVPPTDSWIRVVVGPKVPSAAGPETPGRPQETTVQLEPTFFVDSFRCSAACDPDSYNPLRLRRGVGVEALRAAVAVADATDPANRVPLRRAPRPAPETAGGGEDAFDAGEALTLEDLGYPTRPARTYEVTVARTLVARDGQTLGYTWGGRLECWHQRAFTSFGTGHGVWEASGGTVVPFHARNLRSVTQWVAPVRPDELMPTLRTLQEKWFRLSPPGPGQARRLSGTPDRVLSHGLELGPVLGPDGTGLAWAALNDGPPIARAHASEAEARSTLLQVTHLGLSVKDSPRGTLVFVTRLEDAAPVEGATVTIRKADNSVVWSGKTGPDGQALAPAADLRGDDWWELRFLVTAEKDGDVAYVASDWNDGVEPWSFGVPFDPEGAGPRLRGSVFADRGVYRLGEEVRLKAVVRADGAEGMALLAGKPLLVTVSNGEGAEVDKRTVTLGEWSSADWTLKLPGSGPLGQYTVVGKVEGEKGAVEGGFLVAAYRRPVFRVEANLSAESGVAGVSLAGVVGGRYLFGAPMSGRSVRWTLSRRRLVDAPAALAERWPGDRFVFVDEEAEVDRSPDTLSEKEATLDAEGQLRLELPTEKGGDSPYLYTLEGEVTDVSRQAIAGRSGFRVDPAPFCVGLRRPATFADAARGTDTDVVAVDLAGRPLAGVPVKVTLTQVQWHGVRRAEGNGFYTWETERREVPAGEWTVTSAAEPVALPVPVPGGGFYVLRARASDEAGHATTSATSFYALGAGYTAWERYDHNRIDLVPERRTYRPGETARIMVKSPWEKATALLTTEREGVRSSRVFTLASTQETVEVPITEADIPNLYVSVLLLKGRTGEFSAEDQSDPGKPAFRLGYAELKVDDAAKRLDVTLRADREEYRPAAKARLDLAVRDRQGRPAPAEVTLWAVDVGVLSLTGYRTPDLLGSVWVEKALGVMNENSRQNLISRRAVVPKGGDEGGGGGGVGGPEGTVRRDFRVLAFWLGSVATDATGRATTTVTLPESLTTYRVMAVAGDKLSRFGSAEREIRTSKPVLLEASFPRFLSLGDTARFGAVLHSQLKEKGTAIVTLRCLDASVLALAGGAKQTVPVPARGSVEVRFPVVARAVGTARVQMTVKLLGEQDAFEETLPVRVLAPPETVAAYGQARPRAEETVELPAGVVPGFGGLHLETASTALVGLGEGARYLVDYPYGCAEQRASSALALMLAADLGEAFRLPGLAPAKLVEAARATLKELEEFQCGEGGFAFWKGECATSSPYLTSYVLHVLQRAKALGHPVREQVLEKAYVSLEADLGKAKRPEPAWWPAYAGWQAFAVRVLARGGRNVDSHLTRLLGSLDRTPVFAHAHLLDALEAKGEKGARVEELERRLRNAVRVEGGTAHVEESADPHLLWLWSSSARSTALALGALVRRGGEAPDPLVPGLVRWLLAARKNGRWGSTQENAAALEALVDYYARYEAELPDFSAVVSLGGDTLVKRAFRGRSSEAEVTDVPLRELLRGKEPEKRLPLVFEKEGTGTLHYSTRLRYAVDAPTLEPMDQGLLLERSYAPLKADGTPEGTGPADSFAAGQLVEVTLTLRTPKEVRYVALTDPLPAGLEPVESLFSTTAAYLAGRQEREEAGDWASRWRKGGFDRVERHDDRVDLFATRLSAGDHTFRYVARATTAGRFRAAPTHAEQMYEPEVFGRTGSATVEVR